MRRGGDRGSVSGTVVCLSMSLFAVVGLVFDGGRIVNTYGELASLATSAARLGGQEIIGIRRGDAHIDGKSARQAMIVFLNEHGEVATYDIGRQELSVTLSRRVRTTLLSLVGVSDRVVVVTRTVELVQG